MSSVVHVSGISSSTSEKDIRDFFSFCGKISDLKIEDSSASDKKATVTFEKETAAKTALLLDSTQLGPAQIHVTTGSSTGATSTSNTAGEQHDENDVPQDEKPRSRIFAEYLAHGYVISDKAIERAIALDQQHGVSQKFLGYLNGFDEKYKVTDKAKAADEKYAVTAKANTAWGGLASYFDKAINTPTGQKLRTFYVQGNKQVLDVHNEARHLANLQGGKASSESAPTESGSKVGVEEAGLETVPGTEKTKCNCGSSTEKCPCAPGKCACSNCAKNPDDAPAAASTS
jgi:hypothetical protein